MVPALYSVCHGEVGPSMKGAGCNAWNTQSRSLGTAVTPWPLADVLGRICSRTGTVTCSARRFPPFPDPNSCRCLFCVNKVLLKHSVPICFCGVCGCFCSTAAELSSWIGDPVACETESTYFVAFQRKSFASSSGR